HTLLGRSCVAAQFADLDSVANVACILARTLACDCHRGGVVVGLDDAEAGDDFLGFDVGAVGDDACLDKPAARLQTVAADNRRAVPLHPCVPGRLQSLQFLRRRLGPGAGGVAKDEQELWHDGTPDGFAYGGGGPSPAFCDYNEQAATVRTPAREKGASVAPI